MASPTRAAGSELAERLRARRSEIEGEVLNRVHSIANPDTATEPGYAEGLRGAVAVAIDYGLTAVEDGEGHEPPIPVALLAQARVAARNGVSLDTVLRRYFAGYTLLGYFTIEEAGKEGLIGAAGLQQLLARQAAGLDRLLAAVAEEHGRESEALPVSPEQRRARQIERLLAGEQAESSGIPYGFDGWHLGLIATGPAAVEAIRGLARELNLRSLLVDRGEERTVWAWLGAPRPPDCSQVKGFASANSSEITQLVLGEPAEGLVGWRLTHRQAAAALPVAQRSGKNPVSYREVALLAATLRDDLLSASLRQLYLDPLDRERDGGVMLKETLRAYLAGGRSHSAAAAKLGVSRRAVSYRLQRVEASLGCHLHTVLTDIDVALWVEDLEEANLLPDETSVTPQLCESA